MDYYIDSHNTGPYDYVIVCPPEDIDPDYLTPPSRSRYSLNSTYGGGEDLYYPSYDTSSYGTSRYTSGYQSYTPTSSYRRESSLPPYTQDYTSEYLNKYIPPRSTTPVGSRALDFDADALEKKYSKRISSSTDYASVPNYVITDKAEAKQNETYLEKLRYILSSGTCIGVPSDPTNIYGNIYVGTSANAENAIQVKKMGFTHLLNCAGKRKVLVRSKRGNPHPPEVGVKAYEELYLGDGEHEDLSPHLGKAHQFLDAAKSSAGNVLVYDDGVSRSGAIVLSYMVRSGFPLLKSAKILKDKRRVALCNVGFMEQLVRFARQYGSLDSDVDKFRAPKFGGPGDKHRLMMARFPTFI